MAIPFSRVPFAATEIVSTIEQLGKWDTAKLGDGEKGCGFHLYRQASLCSATLHFGHGFPIQPISRPRFGQQILDLMGLEDCF
jgi:hypothetical protein